MPANCSSSVPWIPCAKRGVLPAVSPAPKTPNGWSTPSGPLRDPSRCSTLWAAISTAWPSPTTGCWISKTVRSVSQWKNYRDSGQTQTMTLSADEFIRLFLLACVAERFPTHSVLPVFWEIATGNRNLPSCRRLLGMPMPNPDTVATPERDYRDHYERLTGCSLRQCPQCLRGHMVTVAHPAKIREMSLPCSNHHRFVMSATPDPKLATPWGWPGPVWGRSVTWTFRYRGTRFNTVPKAPYWLPILSFGRSLSDSLSALRASHMPTLHLLLSKPDDSNLIVRSVDRKSTRLNSSHLVT